MSRKSINTIYHLILSAIFCLGIFLRIKGYLYNKSFWYDEAALALNIIDRNVLELLQPLDYVQCAPYLFLVVSKIMTILFGASEYILRFLPLIFGILSIFAFYLLSKEVLNKKYSILIANILFCINYNLIYYSEEFKQYSLEVLITILSILYLTKLDIRLFDNKKCMIFGLLFFLSFLFSMPQIIVLGAFVLFIAFVLYKQTPGVSYVKMQQIARCVFYIFLPFVILLIPYYFLYLAPNKEIMMASPYMWNNKYISLNFYSIKDFIINFYYFAFYPNHSQLLSLILTGLGTFYLYRDKRRINVFILLVILIALMFSILHIYPLYGRIALYIVPLMILIMVKPLDKISFNKENFKKPVMFLHILIILTFYFCFKLNSVKYLSRFFNENIFYKCYAREFLEIVKENSVINAEIIFKDVNPVAYKYYIRTFNMNPDNFLFYRSKPDGRKISYDEIFVKSVKGEYYWFYVHKYNTQASDNKTLKLWLNKNNAVITFEKKFQSPDGYAEISLIKFK